MNGFSLYLRLIGVSLRAQMQYPVSFLLSSFGGLLLTGIEFIGIWALFTRFGQLNGWHLGEAAVLYGIINVSFALAEAFARGFDTFDSLIRSGNFDQILLRPLNPIWQIAGRELQLMRIGRLGQGSAVLLWGLWQSSFSCEPWSVLLLSEAIVGGAALFSGLFVLQATLAFWTVDSLEIVNTVTYGGVETAQFPLEIYQPWFRAIFTFVIPLACVSYFPAHLVLGRALPLGVPTFWPWLSPWVGVVFFFFSLRIWNWGISHYTSTGS